MAETVYASFPTAIQCEQAAGALLDYGVRKEDISLVAHESLRNSSETTARTRAAGDTMGLAAVAGIDTVNPILPAASTTGTGAVAVPVTGLHASETGAYDTASIQGSGTQVDYLDPHDATERATGTPAPVSNIDIDNYREDIVSERADIEGSSKQGISVTTPADAASGAAKGAGIGLGLGVLAGIAALALPGVGWVIGGGALATAIAGALGTTAAGAAAGGVVGYLKDQGMPDHVAADYHNNITTGGAMLAVLSPSNNVDAATIQSVLQKYGATSVNAY